MIPLLKAFVVAAVITFSGNLAIVVNRMMLPTQRLKASSISLLRRRALFIILQLGLFLIHQPNKVKRSQHPNELTVFYHR